jgi:hypothetical protein
MPLSAEGTKNVKAILDSVTSEGKSGAPGLVFVAVDKSGKTLVEHAAGTNGVDSTEKVDLDTTFWIASMVGFQLPSPFLAENIRTRLMTYTDQDHNHNRGVAAG